MISSLLVWLRRKGNPDADYWKTNRVKSRESCEIAHVVHGLVNWERTSRGIAPMSYDHHLAFIARGHSKDMAHYNYLGHINKGGKALLHGRFGRGISAGAVCTPESRRIVTNCGVRAIPVQGGNTGRRSMTWRWKR